MVAGAVPLQPDGSLTTVALGPTTAVRHMQAFLAGADPDRVTTTQAVDIVRACVELEKLAAAGKTLFAGRAAQSPVWADEGYVTPTMWLADQTKTPIGDAAAVLAASKALGDLPGTVEALRRGSLSAAQAKEVTRAARHDPSAERALLGVAASGSLQDLKEKALQVLAQASSAEEEAARHRRLHERRALRHFTDHEGALRLDGRFAPEAGAKLLASLQAETDRLFEAARKEGTHEPVSAYRADALVNLVTGRASKGDARDGTGSARVGLAAYTTVIRVDAPALARGHVQAGEVCEIAGVGPVSVARVRKLLPESFVKVVFRDTVEVHSVCHVGRKMTAHMQSGLDERDPRCVVPGCTVAHGLENHHWVEDFASSGTTSLAELARLCPRHHDMISYQGWRLEGGPGAWRFVAPVGSAGGGLFEDTG